MGYTPLPGMEQGGVTRFRVTIAPSSLLTSLLLLLLLCALAVGPLGLSPAVSIVAGLLAVAVHWASALAHQLGHAVAARRTGHPMIGVRLWGLLSTSLYPPDEPPLPASVHVRRALGGPAASVLLSLLAAVIAAALRSAGGPAWWVALFFLLDNVVVFTLGSFAPLRFTDGGTLLRWSGKRGQGQ